MKCSQPGCVQEPAYRYSLPTGTERHCCAGHASVIVANGLGIGIQIVMTLLVPLNQQAGLKGPAKPDLQT